MAGRHEKETAALLTTQVRAVKHGQSKKTTIGKNPPFLEGRALGSSNG